MSALENGELGESLACSHPSSATITPKVLDLTLSSPTARLMLDPQGLQVFTPNAAPVQGWTLTCQQLRALLHKRFLLAHRSHWGLFAQVTRPGNFRGCVTVLGCLLSMSAVPSGTSFHDKPVLAICGV